MGVQLGDRARILVAGMMMAAAGRGEVSLLGMGAELRDVWRLESTGLTHGLGGTAGESHQENRWI